MTNFPRGMDFLSLNAEDETDFKGIQIGNLTINEDNVSLMDIDEENFLATSENSEIPNEKHLLQQLPIKSVINNGNQIINDNIMEQSPLLSRNLLSSNFTNDTNMSNYNDYQDEDYIMDMDSESSFNAGEQRIEEAEIDKEGNIVVLPKTSQSNIFSKDKNTSPIGDFLSGISKTGHAILSPTQFGADLAKKSLFKKFSNLNNNLNSNSMAGNNTSVHTASFCLSDNDSLHPFFVPSDDTYTETPTRRNTQVRKNLFERRFMDFRKSLNSEKKNESVNATGVENKQDTNTSSDLRHSISTINRNEDAMDELNIVDDMIHENYASPLRSKSPPLSSIVPQFSPIAHHNTSSTPNVKSMAFEEPIEEADLKENINDEDDEIDEINLENYQDNNALTPIKPASQCNFETPKEQFRHTHTGQPIEYHNHFHYHAGTTTPSSYPISLDSSERQDTIITRTNTSPDNLPSPWSKRIEYAKSPTAYMISTYIQLVFHVSILVCFGYIFFNAIQTIQTDISKKFQERSDDILMEASLCYQNYHNNKCENMPPALERQCFEWGRCMNKQPNLSTYQAMIAAETFGNLINSFVAPIGTKAFSFFIVSVLFWIFGSNLAFGFIRGKSFYGNDAKELINEGYYNGDNTGSANNQLQVLDVKKTI